MRLCISSLTLLLLLLLRGQSGSRLSSEVFTERARHFGQLNFVSSNVSHNVDEYHKPLAENRSRIDRHVAWIFVRDGSLALLHGYPRHHAVSSVLLRLRAPGLERSQADGWSERHSGLHADVSETAEPLAQSSVRYTRLEAATVFHLNAIGDELQNIFRYPGRDGRRLERLRHCGFVRMRDEGQSYFGASVLQRYDDPQRPVNDFLLHR